MKRALTLRRAIVLVVVLGLLAPAALISGYSWFKRFNGELQQQTGELLEQHVDALTNGMQEPLWNINQASATALMNAMMARNEDIVSIEVRDNALGVFVSAARPERRIGYTASGERPVAYRGNTIGSIRMEVGSARLRAKMVHSLTEQMLAVAAQFVLSIALILWLLEKRLAGPLQRLGEGAQRLANRQLDVPFTWRRLDEIGLLGQRLEDTRISLRKLFGELDQKNRELEQDICVQRRAEQALHQSEAKFAGAFQCNPDSIAITRVADGLILDINDEFVKASGYSREELLGKSTLELNLYVDAGERRELVEILRRDGIVRDFPWQVRTKAGAILECLSNGTIFDIDHELYILAVIRDVTRQRRIERQKAEADRALLRLAHGTRGMTGESFFELLVADLASALRTDCAFIALRIDETPDRLRTMVNHVEGRVAGNFEYCAIGAPCEQALAGELSLYPTGLRERFPDDRALIEKGWDSYAGAPLRDASGTVIGVLAVLHTHALSNPDLVKSLLQVFSERASFELERKRNEVALRNSEQSFSSIFHSSPVAMSVIRMQGKFPILDVNRAFERLFLLEREFVLGKSTLELRLYCDPAIRAATIDIVESTGHRDPYESWMNRSDGSRAYIQISENSFYLNDERFVTTVFEDITEKHAIENRIRDLNANLEQRVIERTQALQQANQELAAALDTLNRAQEELVRSEKLAALGSLVAGVAHELNTPIGNSLMVASTLVDQTRAIRDNLSSEKGLKRSMLESYLGDAGTAGDLLVRNLFRAGNLVTSFKQVAVDQTSSQRRAFSLAEVISEIMTTLWPTLKKTSYAVVQKIPNEIWLDSYPGPLGQAVTNLINNALLHGFDERDTGTITINAMSTSDGWVELEVKDDGVGIPAANLNRIFDPFFTTKLGAGGSGLGLNIAHNIVTGVLGGRIRVQSEPGIGTNFILSLPAFAPQMQGEETTQPA